MHLQLKEERLRRGWSLTQLSARTGGISAADLSRLERGLLTIWPGWRSRLARAFKLPQAELFKIVDGAPASAPTTAA